MASFPVVMDFVVSKSSTGERSSYVLSQMSASEVYVAIKVSL